VNSALAVSPEGRIAVAAEAWVAVLGPDGRELWSRTPPRRRGLTAPACGALAFAGERLLVGRMDGTVACVTADEGKAVWASEIGAGVSSLAPLGGAGVVARDQEGVVRGVSLTDGRLLWTFVPPPAGDRLRPGPVRAAGDRAVVSDPAAGRIFVLDGASGKVALELPLPGGASFSVGDGRIYLAGRGEIRAYDL
jgi:outer membrane protein assembly factor BamB